MIHMIEVSYRKKQDEKNNYTYHYPVFDNRKSVIANANDSKGRNSY